MSKVTKLSKAVEIVKAAGTKQQALADIQAALGVTKSNAFVYYTKVIKGLDGSSPAPAKRETQEKSLTVMAPQKKAKKINDIDAFIESVKKGAGVSPFTGLGV